MHTGWQVDKLTGWQGMQRVSAGACGHGTQSRAGGPEDSRARAAEMPYKSANAAVPRAKVQKWHTRVSSMEYRV
jgi:hypothetical protein